MKKTFVFLISSLLLIQSCKVYKPVDIADIKEKKTYKIYLDNKQELEARCQSVSADSISVKANLKNVTIPKSAIERIEREKASPFILAGGIAALVAGAVVLITADRSNPNYDMVK